MTHEDGSETQLEPEASTAAARTPPLPGVGDEFQRKIRAYKRAASILRDVFEGSPEEFALKFEWRGVAGEPSSASFSAGARVFRQAALLRPFMASTSPIELGAMWHALIAAGAVSDETRARIEQSFERSERLAMSLVLNGRPLTARDIYFAYGEGKFFADDLQAKEMLAQLNLGPMAALVPMLFHDASIAFASLVFEVLEELLSYERANLSATPDERPARCIYCGAGDGDFGSEEHVLPESLAGDMLVIREVCAECNNRLSRFDQVLIDFEPVALLRTVYGPLSKKGKFPRAEFRDMTIEKTAPRHIRVRGRRGAKAPNPPEPQPDGTVSFTISATGRSRFDPVPLARSLFKIGLGLVAHDAGPEAALEDRYAPARAFVLHGTPIGTEMWIAASKPHPRISTLDVSGARLYGPPTHRARAHTVSDTRSACLRARAAVRSATSASSRAAAASNRPGSGPVSLAPGSAATRVSSGSLWRRGSNGPPVESCLARIFVCCSTISAGMSDGI